MIGILLVTHGKIAAELVEAACRITGQSERIAAIGLEWEEAATDARDRIEEGIARVRSDAGVLVLTDMFGGTPSNLAFPFLKEDSVEIVTGVNLPMLLRSLATRGEEPLSSLARAARERGRKAIEVASDFLSERTATAPIPPA
jgi:PTS system mannose-specific IIA component